MVCPMQRGGGGGGEGEGRRSALFCRQFHVGVTWVEAKVKVLPLVEPDLCQAGVVVVDDLGRAAGERVGRRLAEDVADVRARGD